jgi:FkbM family methyltransferase
VTTATKPTLERLSKPSKVSPDAVNGTFKGGNWVANLLLRYAREFPAHRGKTRGFEALARLSFGHDLPVVSTTGARLVIDPFDYIGHAICFGGGYEPLSLALACQIMRDGGVFLDVGANFGLYSCCVGMQPGVECIAIDANPAAIVRLQENMRLNVGARITPVVGAVGNERSLVELMPHDCGNLGTGRVAKIAESPSRARFRVPCIPLSELLAELGVGPIKLMKIDVEGYELQVLRGLDFNSVHAPSHIIAEHKAVVASSGDLDVIFHLLTASGYKPFTITGEEYDNGAEVPEDNLWWRRER